MVEDVVGAKLDASMAMIGCQLVETITESSRSSCEHEGLVSCGSSASVVSRARSEGEKLKSKVSFVT